MRCAAGTPMAGRSPLECSRHFRPSRLASRTLRHLRHDSPSQDTSVA